MQSKETFSKAIYKQVLQNIQKIYDGYEQKANELATNKRHKVDGKVDEMESRFLSKLKQIDANMLALIEEMRKQEKDLTPQFRESIGTITACLGDIRIILKKQLTFKATKGFSELIQDTENAFVGIRKGLPNVRQTKFLCCGTDGNKLFKEPMNFFRIVAGKWKMISLFESKDSVENFISPKFSEKDFQFIFDILIRKWQEPKTEVIEKKVEVIKYVPSTDKDMDRPREKQSNIALANENLISQNFYWGLQLYHHQADKNSNPKACGFLGKVYEDGHLLARDSKKSLYYYQKGMNGKDVFSTSCYAKCLIKGQFNPNKEQSAADMEKAHNLLADISSGENPCPQALVELAELYGYGVFKEDFKKLFPVEKDIKKAVGYYAKARSLHLPRASNDLAVLYMNERPDDNDPQSQKIIDKKIIFYLEEARDMAYVQAFYNLGMIYSKGLLSQRKDPQKALQMFYEGSLKGDDRCKIKFAYELMNQTSIRKEEFGEHYNLARIWLQTVIIDLQKKEQSALPCQTASLRKERAEANFYMGLFYEHGFGIDVSTRCALEHYINSSDLGFAAGMNKVADFYYLGAGGLEKDNKLAIGMYIEASESGDSDAMVSLGTFYLNGIPEVIPANYKKAYQYFIEANKLDNSNALIHLSHMYRKGLLVEKNQKQAKQLLEQAAKQKNSMALFMLKEKAEFNSHLLFDNLEYEFFPETTKINLKQIIPLLSSGLRPSTERL